MSRSSWRNDPPFVYGLIIGAALIAVVAILYAAPQPDRDYTRHQQQADQEHADSKRTVTFLGSKAVKKFKSEEEKWPCDSGQDNRNSDLCAQWKAADAASSAAWWAMVSTILAAIGTGFLLHNLKLTRDAVRVATDAAKDQDRSLAIAETAAQAASRSADAAYENAKLSKAQIEPYVSILDCSVVVSQKEINGEITIINTGPTPGRHMQCETHVFIISTNNLIEKSFALGSLVAIGDLATDRPRGFIVNRNISEGEFEGIKNIEAIIQIECTITFYTVFGEKKTEWIARSSIGWPKNSDNIRMNMAGSFFHHDNLTWPMQSS